jgi:hypothetical protein
MAEEDRSDESRCAETWVRVKCDWGAEGLWTTRGAMIPLDSLPLSAALKQRLLAWQAHFDEHAEPWEPDNKFDWDTHRATGIEIARALKAELPGWTVVADDRLVEADGTLGVRVPYPGEAG